MRALGHMPGWLALAGTVAAAVACATWSGQPSGRGWIRVAIHAVGSGPRELQALPAGIARVEIDLSPAESGAFPPQRRSLDGRDLAGSAVVTFDPVPVGTAIVSARAIDRGGAVRAESSREVEVEDGRARDVELEIALPCNPCLTRTVLRVRVSTESIALNAMPDGLAAAEDDLPASIGIEAMAVTAEGDCPECLLIWSTTDPGRVTVAGGIVRARRGAPQGLAEIVVTSADSPAVSATISVVVTRDGAVDLEVR